MAGDSDIFKVFDRGEWKRAKHCVQCDEVFTDRARWDEFSAVKYCSSSCRREAKEERRASRQASS